MEWRKVVEREGDFLKNYLMYESFLENFPKIFGINHSDFLTIRKGKSFTHYVHNKTAENVSSFIRKQTEKNPNFIGEVAGRGKKTFYDLLDFCQKTEKLEFGELDNARLKKIMAEYFRLYKEPYPYFNLSLFVPESENFGEAAETMADLRFFGRESFNKAHQLISPLFEETGKRIGLREEELKFLTPAEIMTLLDGKKIDKMERMKDRQVSYLLHKNGKFELNENESINVNEETMTAMTELRGTGTIPAIYRGKVRIVKNLDDIKKMDYGDVIVSRMVTPDMIVEGIEKANAIITDEGGVTCHAATISREFGIPALFGTGSATRILRDGDIVEVDTAKGIANIVRRF